MLVLGITGNIATGKSTFARELTGLLGAASFDADRSAKILLERDPLVIHEVKQQIGLQFFGTDGTLDRGALRDHVFTSTAARRTLENILHPRIRLQRLEAVKKTRAEGNAQTFVAEIPLLYETNGQDDFDFVVVVGCSKQTQLQRLTQSRHLPEEIATSMAAAQMPLLEKIYRCDLFVWNDGTAENLSAQTLATAQLIESIA